MATLEEKILNFGKSNVMASLKKLLRETSLEELTELIQKRVVSTSFAQTWNYILKGFSVCNSTGMREKKMNLILEMLQALSKSEIPSSQVNDILTYINADLSKCTTDNLMQLSNFFVESFQNNMCNHLCYKELFPEIISILSEKDSVDFNGSEVNGKEFKKQLISALCMLQWPQERVTPIMSMFIEMPLTNEEHLQVLNKLGTYIEKLTPQEIPSFVFQLLKLCVEKNCLFVFMKLQTYFGLRIYESANLTSYSSSESDMDIIESSSHLELLQAESTVLYHIHNLALMSSNAIKEYLVNLKNMIKAPEFILHPFQLAVLLTILTAPQYEEKVFDILKSSVTRYYNEIHKKEVSMWFNDIIPKSPDLQSIFNQVITVSLQDRDTVLQGLVNFAFVLLNIKSGLPLIFIDPVAEKQWNLGMLILVKLIKHKWNRGGIVLQEIINNILTNQNVTQYINCLHFLSKNLAIILLENQACIIDVLENLIQIPGSTATQLLNAIMPLTKVSSTIRDHLILLLRKALYSNKTETRQMAVLGYIKLLTHLKISNVERLSQFTDSMNLFSSGPSLCTQLSLNRSSQCSQNPFSNEALCLEILSILRRCFMQKLEVKTKLYEGLYHAVCQNPEIRIPVLDILWMHFSIYFIVDEEISPPLDFSKISITKDVDVIQQESFGKLLHIIGLIVTQKENQESAPSVERLIVLLESICHRMMNCELNHFELNDGTDLSDILPESQQKSYVLQEALLSYEALIAYKINSWTSDTPENGQHIVSLFQVHTRLVHFSKNIGKSKKIKKKSNDSDASSNMNNTASKKEQKSTFHLPETLLNFQTIIKALQLLHEPIVGFASIQEANTVKSKKEIQRHILQSASHLVSCLKSKKHVIDVEENKTNFRNIISVADIIYNRCIKNLRSFIDYDCISAVLVAECFHAILNCVYSCYKENVLIFLRKIVQEKNGTLIFCLGEVFKVYQKLFEMDEELENEDPEIKKLPLVIVNSLSVLSNFIPSESTSLSIEFYDWLHNFAKTQKLNSKIVATPFFAILFSVQLRFKKDIKLFEEVISSISSINGTLHDDTQDLDRYSTIDERTVNHAYLCMANAVKTFLDEVEWVLVRLKSEYIISGHVEDQNNFRRKEGILAKEKGICCQLCFLVGILTTMSGISVQSGPLAEALFKNISHFYTIVTNFTKYFNTRSSKVFPAFQGSRFEKLVRFIGRELTPSVNNLILYLEEESKRTQPSQARKKSENTSSLKTKILKDTRLIPKVAHGIEQFSSCIIQLSNKTKIDLSKHIGQGTTRDFRIMVQQLEAPQRNADQSMETEQNDSDSQSTQVEDSISEETEEISPPSKKSRKS